MNNQTHTHTHTHRVDDSQSLMNWTMFVQLDADQTYTVYTTESSTTRSIIEQKVGETLKRCIRSSLGSDRLREENSFPYLGTGCIPATSDQRGRRIQSPLYQSSDLPVVKGFTDRLMHRFEERESSNQNADRGL